MLLTKYFIYLNLSAFRGFNLLRPLQVLSVLLLLTTAGCATKNIIPDPLIDINKDVRGSDRNSSKNITKNKVELRESEITTAPNEPITRTRVGRPAPEPLSLDSDKVDASLSLDNMPLPQFIQTVFNGILKLNTSIDPQVSSRTDIISLRSAKPQTANQIFAAATSVLRAYGVSVIQFDGIVRVVPSNSNSGIFPEIYRGRALPEVPQGVRPVFVWLPIEKVRVNTVVSNLRTFFGSSLTINEEGQSNAILLSGQSDIIIAAQEVIKLLDQPSMRSRYTVRVDPAYWAADELAKRLLEVMVAQGYFVNTSISDSSPLLIIPVQQINAVFLFSVSQSTLDHALRWIKEFDQPSQSRIGTGGFITYYLQNTDAASIAGTLNQVLGGAPAGTPVAAASATKVVVNPNSNSLIIRANQSEYQQLYSLLKELDRPARSALVMATIAEVRLTDNLDLGFNWLLAQFSSRGFLWNIGTATTGTLGGRGSGTNIAISRNPGDPRALLTALASENKVKILSNPSLVTKSGESASLSVGSEVPILTSQVSNSNGLTNGIQQTVQYRATGVSLRIKPVVHSSGKIDLDISQEVSAAQTTTTGVNSTPTILSRKLDTKVTVSDGQSLLMGGLITNTVSDGKAGVPFLRDIPIVGNLFNTSYTKVGERTELVLLITCYTMENDFEANAITNAFRAQFPWSQKSSGVLDFFDNFGKDKIDNNNQSNQNIGIINDNKELQSPNFNKVEAMASGKENNSLPIKSQPSEVAPSSKQLNLQGENIPQGSAVVQEKAPVAKKRTPYIVPELNDQAKTIKNSAAAAAVATDAAEDSKFSVPSSLEEKVKNSPESSSSSTTSPNPSAATTANSKKSEEAAKPVSDPKLIEELNIMFKNMKK